MTSRTCAASARCSTAPSSSCNSCLLSFGVHLSSASQSCSHPRLGYPPLKVRASSSWHLCMRSRTCRVTSTPQVRVCSPVVVGLSSPLVSPPFSSPSSLSPLSGEPGRAEGGSQFAQRCGNALSSTPSPPHPRPSPLSHLRSPPKWLRYTLDGCCNGHVSNSWGHPGRLQRWLSPVNNPSVCDPGKRWPCIHGRGAVLLFSCARHAERWSC